MRVCFPISTSVMSKGSHRPDSASRGHPCGDQVARIQVKMKTNDERAKGGASHSPMLNLHHSLPFRFGESTSGLVGPRSGRTFPRLHRQPAVDTKRPTRPRLLSQRSHDGGRRRSCRVYINKVRVDELLDETGIADLAHDGDTGHKLSHRMV